MLSETEREEVDKKLEELKTQIRGIRSTLNEINKEKELWFEKKEAHSSKIQQLIKDIKESKEKRNKLTNSVREDKKEREKITKEIKDKIAEVKKLRKEKESIAKKFSIKGDPSTILKKIESIEKMIETEVMSFQKEQKFMKEIKDLRKKYDEVKGVSDIWSRVHKISSDIKKLKDQAEQIHRKVQSRAKKSQEIHEGIIETSKEIDNLKVKEEESYKKFFELKQKFAEKNKELKDLLSKLNEEAKKLNLDKVESKKEKKKRIKIELRSKEEIVEDKIKKGKKITTEDLLVMQQSEMEKNSHKNS